MAVVAPFPAIYISTNSGSTWSPASGTYEEWVSVASSADGTHLVAASQPNDEYDTLDLIFFSTNSGLTWSSNSAATAT